MSILVFLLKAVIGVVIIFFALVVIHFFFPLLQVVGSSMYPTYKDGEYLRGMRFYPKNRLREGDVIAYYRKEEKRVVIKRIAKIMPGNKLYCLGDNAAESYDSRYYGSVPMKRLVCRVFDQREKEV